LRSPIPPFPHSPILPFILSTPPLAILSLRPVLCALCSAPCALRFCRVPQAVSRKPFFRPAPFAFAARRVPRAARRSSALCLASLS